MTCRTYILLPLVAILTVETALAQNAQTSQAFDEYIASVERRIIHERESAQTFLSSDSLPSIQWRDLLARLRQGEVMIEEGGSTPTEIPDGLIHDWMGTIFIPGASIQQVLELVRDYDHSARYYAPDVVQSRLVSRKNDDLHVFMRLRKRKVITVVLDTEYDVHYGRLDPAHHFSSSRSTRIAEIADPGGPNEHALAAGQDHGYMWRLNSYWAFEQAPDGVFVQCEAVSLTRDVPRGMGWLIGPFVQSIPPESLQFTLTATRTALALP